MTTVPQIVLGIPGQWPTSEAIGGQILASNDALFFAGALLVDGRTGETVRVEVADPDPNLRRAFELSVSEHLSPEDLEAIENHTYLLFLITKGGSLEAARSALLLGNDLLQAGGLALKVESSAIAHSKAGWTALSAQKTTLSVYEAFVTLLKNQESYHSCGMHNLGFPDAAVSIEVPAAEAALLLQAFLQFMILESPNFEEGSTFRQGQNKMPYYTLHMQPCTLYPEDDILFNPYGVWQLVPQ